MADRKYSTAFVIAKISEIFSWIVIIAGIVVGLELMKNWGGAAGFAVMILICIPGFFLVFFSQLTLIFIDTENNTRQAISEIQKTNAMLAATLGDISNNLNKLAKKYKDEK